MRALSIVVLLAGCELGRDAAPDAGPPPDGGVDDDLVPAIGADDTLELATWNIEWFPKSERALALAADVIASLDLDVIVVEEVASVDAWDALVARLPAHAGVLSSHRYTPTEYQKIGVLYREDLVTASAGELLFPGDGYAFPRPPLLVHLTVGETTIALVGLHLKAGTGDDDRARRAEAVRDLDAWARARTEDELVLLGDYNASLDPARPDLAEVWPPLLDAHYTIHTAGAAARDEASFIPSGALIDHVVTTAGLADETGAAEAVIPRLDAMIPRFEADLSDHLPVILVFPLPR